jgi:K+-sensing histidine kinase KdpD
LTTDQPPTYKKDVQVSELLTRRPTAVLAGLLAPTATCAVLARFRSSLPTTDAVLILVLIVVAVAAIGSRLGGVLAALSAGAWFDFFLTRPYESFSIDSGQAIGTTVLLLVIGLGVTELARWGQRQHFRAGEQSGYLAGLHTAAEGAANGGSPTRLTSQVIDQLTELLDLRSCHFHYGTGVGQPRLLHDGSLAWAGRAWDIDRQGLPHNEETELLVSAGGGYQGRFLMTPTSGSRPDRGSAW